MRFLSFKKWIENEEDFGTSKNDIFQNAHGGKFWGNAGAGVILFAKDTGRVLLALRSPYVNEPNTWGTIGG